MRRWFFNLSTLFVLSVCLLVYGCGNDSGGNGPEVIIAAALPISGPDGAFGQAILKGVQLAEKEINDAGGINGSTFVVKVFDDVGKAVEATNVAQKIKGQDSILGVVGHAHSTCSLQGKPIYQEVGIPAISPASTNPQLCKGSKWYFRNIFMDTYQGAGLARYIKKQLELKKVGVFFYNTDYGKGLKDAFIAEAKIIGLDVVAIMSFDDNDTNFRPKLREVIAKNPEIIFIIGMFKQGAQIAKHAADESFTGKLLGSDGVYDQTLISLGGDAVEGMYVTNPFLMEQAGERGVVFKKAYKDMHGEEPNSWAGFGYDAAMLMAEAIEKGGPTREKIRAYLASRNSLENAFMGITGATYFNEDGDCPAKLFGITVVKDGKFVTAAKQPD